MVGLAAVPTHGQSAPMNGAPSAAAARTLIRTGHLLDVTNGNEATGQTIIVTGDVVSGIAATASTPAGPGDAVIDLGNMYVMPGLIDVHTHLTMATNFDPYWELTMTPAKEGHHRRGEREGDAGGWVHYRAECGRG